MMETYFAEKVIVIGMWVELFENMSKEVIG